MKTKSTMILKISKIMMTILLSSTTNFTMSQNVGISANGSDPATSAGLDVDFNNKGILIPRVSLVAVNNASPITSPEISLMVYNTATSGISPNNVTPGFYYWDGSVWLKLNATNTSSYTIEDLRVTIDKGSNSAQLGSLNGITGPEIWFFRNGQGVEAMSFTVQMPHDWVEGTVIYPHIHWVPKTTGTGNVQWNFDYSWADLNETTPETFPSKTTTSAVTIGPFTQNNHLISSLTESNVGIDGVGKSKSSILICRIWRDSGLTNDTYNNDAGGLSIDFHYLKKDVFGY